MNTFLFFFLLLITACSGIGFYESGHPPLSSAQDSLVCKKGSSSYNPSLCSGQNGNNGGFFRKGREETRSGYLTEYFEIPHQRDELEIALILDVSPSMDNNLRRVGKNMMALLSHIQHKKWRMVFMTADHGDTSDYRQQQKWEHYQGSRPRFGKFMPLEKNGSVLDQFILQYDTPRYVQIFKDTLTRESSLDCNKAPYCQPGTNEQPLRSLQSAILRYEAHEELQQLFFKPHTDTVAIIITDEDERREDQKNATSAKDVIATFMQVFQNQRKRLFGFSISIQDEQCYRKEDGDYGRMVGRLADLTLGKNLFGSKKAKSGNISLCSKNYGKALADISQITRTVTESLTLEKMFYIPETVDIQLSPAQPNVSWQFYGRKLVFSKNIRPGTKVKVSYQYEQKGDKSGFS